MYRLIRIGTLLESKLVNYKKVVRPFMSERFSCNEEWNKRLDSNLLKKVKLSDLFFDLDNKFNQQGKVCAVDIDIFINAVKDASYLEEMEDLVHRFRLSSEAYKVLDSTHHAFIRSFLLFGESNELIRILNDRLNYGIFADDYCNVLLMDHFIKENNFTNAGKIATNQMLQEDFDNVLVKYFSLYSCHRYLQEPGIWEKSNKVEEVVNEEDEEEVKVRVRYIRNPYFDDHFDLNDPFSLIGKTFKMIGENDEDTISNSYRLLGCTLYKKWNDTIDFSNDIIRKNKKINSGCVDEIEKFISSLPQEDGEKDNEVQEKTNQIKGNLIKIKKNNLIVEKELLSATEDKLNFCTNEMEDKLIKEQCQIYEAWEAKRGEVLKEELEEIRRLQRIENIKLKKEELEKKEQELFFFDIEEDLDLKIEAIEQEKRVRNKGKKVKKDETEYIPPEIVKRRSQ